MYGLRRVLIFLALITALSHSLQAQTQDKEQSKLYMEQADEIMAATQAMDDARDIMVTAADYDTSNVRANYEAGRMYLLTINKDRATKFFLRVYRLNPNYKYDLAYSIGKGYQLGLDFNNAARFYTIYRAKALKSPEYKAEGVATIEDVNRRLAECKVGKELIAHPQNYEIVNLGKTVNSEFEDYAPVLSEKEDELVFTTRRRDDNTNENVAIDNKPYEDVFTSRNFGNGWTKAKPIGPKINVKFNDSNLALSADAKTLFVYIDPGDIYYSERQKDGTWGVPISLPGLVNTTFKESSISINHDGTRIYFASTRPGGLGGSDIYVVTKDSHGEWTRIKNLGPQINSDQDEDGPFIDRDEKVLFFSSQGKKGMGGHDIYKSNLLNIDKNEWSEPENLGYPINTPDDDVFYVTSKDGKRGYYSSVRDDGFGYSDIYMITISDKPAKTPDTTKAVVEKPPLDTAKVVAVKTPEVKTPEVKIPEVKTPVAETKQPLTLQVTVVDADTKSPMEAKVRLQVAATNKMVGVNDKGAGIYDFTISEDKPTEYRISVEKEGYVFLNQKFSVEGRAGTPKTISKQIELRKVQVGVTSILRNIYFEFDRASFRKESYSELNKLEEMMRQNPGMSLEVAGHTDYIGTREYNRILSLNRANAVRSFLTSKGIDPRRVTTVGYGKERPLVSNDDEKDGREINRRVEFKVIRN